MVNNGIPSNEVNPSFELRWVLELPKALLGIFKKTSCKMSSAVAGSDTRERMNWPSFHGKLVPDMFERCVHHLAAGFMASMLADTT